jgi:hypothetical protein
MAIQPIVMKSRLISDNLGALPNVYGGSYTAPDPVKRDATVRNVTLDEDGNEKITYTIPTYERTQIDIPADFDWSQYGKAGPALRFFNQVRTGEIEYDPSKDKIDVDAMMGGTDGPPLSTEAEMIKQELISAATMVGTGVGAQVGRSVAAASVAAPDAGALANIGQGVSDFASNFKAKDLLRSPSSGPASKVLYSPGTENALYADKLADFNTKIAAGNNVTARDIALDKGAATAKINAGKEAATAKAAFTASNEMSYLDGVKDRASSGIFGGEKTVAGTSNLYGGIGAGLTSVAFNLISGKSLKESIKTGAKTGVGTWIGGLVGGPIGAFLGGMLGGRVICNELMRQGIMTRKQVVLDYKFTEDYLTPQHVAGYHVWAVWMVRQMRKGRLVNFWAHVAGHRANEIAYIYGERDKPDYLGKVYRKILEPICWSIGFFCQKTDWTVLYKEKEI